MTVILLSHSIITTLSKTLRHKFWVFPNNLLYLLPVFPGVMIDFVRQMFDAFLRDFAAVGQYGFSKTFARLVTVRRAELRSAVSEAVPQRRRREARRIIDLRAIVAGRYCSCGYHFMFIRIVFDILKYKNTNQNVIIDDSKYDRWIIWKMNNVWDVLPYRKGTRWLKTAIGILPK